MKNIDYDIPIFESNDVANLNLYSEKMAEAIKGQIDKFGNPLAFKEIKQNISELDLISNPQSGDIYGVIETNKNYIWNGKEWIIYSDIMELENYYNKEEINQKIKNIQALPTGGTKGQVLTKQSETDGDANWEDIEANEVYIGKAEEAPSSAKIIVEDEDFEESAGLSKSEVYVGAEEPITGEKVWFRKGKNYLDISKLKSRTTYGITFTPTNTGIKITGTATNTYAYGSSIKIDLKKGKTYTLYGKNAGNTLKIELKKTGTSVMSIKTSGDKVTFTTSEDIDSITFILEGITKGTTYDYEITNIQIEPGSSAKPYEAYVEPQIYVRNSNGVYEEFIKKSEEVYSTEEQVIGTWIDGKPLYRKVVEMGNMTKDNYKMKAHNIQNMKYARIVDVSMQRGNQSSGNFQLFSVGNVGGKYNDTQVGFDTYIDSNCVYVYCNGDRTLFVGTAIIEYTKTTD